MVFFRLISLPIMLLSIMVGCKSTTGDGTTMNAGASLQVAEKPAVLATLGDEAMATDDLRITFARNGGGVAFTFKAGAQICVVHNNRSGSQHEGIGSLTLSPNGSRVAYSATDNGTWRVVVDGRPGEQYDMVEGEQFSPDGKHYLYQGMKGNQWQLIVDGRIGATANKRIREYGFTGDSAHVVYIAQDEEGRKGRLIVTDLDFKTERTIAADVVSVYFNSDKSAVAAVVKSGTNREHVIRFTLTRPDDIKRGAEYDRVLNIAQTSNDAELAYFGERKGKMYCVLNDHEEPVPVGIKPGATVINPTGKSVGALLTLNNTAYLYEMSNNSSNKGQRYDEAEWLVYRPDGTVSAFTARKEKVWFVVTNGAEGPAFDRVVSPKFSPDGKYLVYRARKDGKRFVVVADAAGNVLRQHPEYEQVFDLQFTADGKSVAYGVKDGKYLAWKVEPL